MKNSSDLRQARDRDSQLRAELWREKLRSDEYRRVADREAYRADFLEDLTALRQTDSPVTVIEP